VQSKPASVEAAAEGQADDRIGVAPAVTLGQRQIYLDRLLYQMKLHRQRPEFEAAALQILVEEIAVELGLEPTVAELQAEADAYRRAKDLQWSTATRFWLERNGLSLDDFEALIAGRVMRRKLKNAKVGEKVERFFLLNRRRFDCVALTSLVVPDETAAQDSLARVQHGGDPFGPAQGTKDEGIQSLADVKPAIAAAVQDAAEGAVLGPFAVDDGYLLVRVDRQLPGTLDDETRALIAEHLFEDWLRAEARRRGLKIHFEDFLPTA